MIRLRLDVPVRQESRGLLWSDAEEGVVFPWAPTSWRLAWARSCATTIAKTPEMPGLSCSREMLEEFWPQKTHQTDVSALEQFINTKPDYETPSNALLIDGLDNHLMQGLGNDMGFLCFRVSRSLGFWIPRVVKTTTTTFRSTSSGSAGCTCRLFDNLNLMRHPIRMISSAGGVGKWLSEERLVDESERMFMLNPAVGKYTQGLNVPISDHFAQGLWHRLVVLVVVTWLDWVGL